MKRTRFAPSPTGPLHLGHAYAALIAARVGDEMLLRIEDLDQSRARTQWEDAIHSDLEWLGVTYPRPVMRQSERSAAYDAALDRLWDMGVLYPCTCTRRDIASAVSAPQNGEPPMGPDGVIYPGTCRPKPRPKARPTDVALRLDMNKAAQDIVFQEDVFKPGLNHWTAQSYVRDIGDVVLARPGMGAAYHLAVVVDDAAQGITHVTRGHDLFDATAVHVLLQRTLGLPTPDYHHHALIRDDAGKRLAKRDDARAIAVYREAGWSAEALRTRLLANPETPVPLTPAFVKK